MTVITVIRDKAAAEIKREQVDKQLADLTVRSSRCGSHILERDLPPAAARPVCPAAAFSLITVITGHPPRGKANGPHAGPGLPRGV